MNIDRFETMIAFLENLPPEKFYFGTYGDCNSVACAIGHRHNIWPDHEFSDGDCSDEIIVPEMAAWLDIPEETVKDLFFPVDWRSTAKLSKNAPPIQVAQLLWEFITDAN